MVQNSQSPAMYLWTGVWRNDGTLGRYIYVSRVPEEAQGLSLLVVVGKIQFFQR